MKKLTCVSMNIKVLLVKSAFLHLKTIGNKMLPAQSHLTKTVKSPPASQPWSAAVRRGFLFSCCFSSLTLQLIICWLLFPH